VRLFVAVAAVGGSLALAAPAGALVQFESPSHNIGCVLSAKFGARCDIRTHAWKPPPKPKWCDLDWGDGLEVGRRGNGHFVCAGDTALGGKRVLGYHKSITRGRFRCTSYRNGMRCVNVRNTHGFKIARRKATWF
jgi:Family of unknown function (DUF6636)